MGRAPTTCGTPSAIGCGWAKSTSWRIIICLENFGIHSIRSSICLKFLFKLEVRAEKLIFGILRLSHFTEEASSKVDSTVRVQMPARSL